MTRVHRSRRCPPSGSKVVIELHAEIDKAVAELAAKRYRALVNGLRSFQTSSVARTVLLKDALRRDQLTYSGRSLWLLMLVATDGSAEQISKKLMDAHGDVLNGERGDLRPLLRVLGSRRTIPLDSLEGTRTSLPAGDWVGQVKLGALKAATAEKVVKAPRGMAAGGGRPRDPARFGADRQAAAARCSRRAKPLVRTGG